MRNIQLDLRWIRQKGLAFWYDFPEDERRYWWFAVTVNVPPSYARSVEEWASSEAEIGPNRAPIDEVALRKWDDTYDTLYEELLDWPNPPAYADQLRRYVWSGALEDKVRHSTEADARGVEAEHRLNAGLYLDSLLELAATFPVPVSAADGYSHLDSVHRIYELLVQKNVYGLSSDQELQFLDSLMESQHSLANTYRDHFEESGKLPLGLVERAAELQLAELPATVTGWSWDTVIDDPPSGSILSLIRLNKRKGAENGYFFESGLFYYRYYIPDLRHRVLVSKYWESLTLEEKADSLRLSCSFAPSHRGDLPALLFSGGNVHPMNAIGAQLEKDNRLYDDLEVKIQRLISRQDLTAEERDKAVATDFICRQNRVRYEWSHWQDKKRILALAKQGLQALRQSSGLPTTSKTLAEFIRYFSSSKRNQIYGLTDTELSSIVSPFLDAKHEELRATARAYFERVELVPGARVRVEAPTMSGAPFDTEDLEGKIVLLDHWDTQCAPCIAAMPSIHETYLEYKDRGFEVVSIAYDGESRRNAVDRYKHEMGLTWTTLNGEGLWGGVSVKYGLTGFPSYMLLDREGRFVAGNDELRDVSKLPEILDEVLAADASVPESATVD